MSHGGSKDDKKDGGADNDPAREPAVNHTPRTDETTEKDGKPNKPTTGVGWGESVKLDPHGKHRKPGWGG